LSSPGTMTLATAIPAPIRMVPPKSAVADGAMRISVPIARTIIVAQTVRSMPKRRASFGASGASSPKQITGRVVSMLAEEVESPVSSTMVSIRGAVADRMVRRLKATARMPPPSMNDRQESD
jgi:hypothetical protein